MTTPDDASGGPSKEVMIREHRADDDDRINRLVLGTRLGAQAVYRYGTWGIAAERPDNDLDIAVLLSRDAAGRVDRRRWHLLAVEIAGAVRAHRPLDLQRRRRRAAGVRALVLSMPQRLTAERAGIRAVIVGGPPPPAR